jgi:hypothetical protein
VNIIVYSLKKLYRYYMLIVEKSEVTDMHKENVMLQISPSREKYCYLFGKYHFRLFNAHTYVYVFFKKGTILYISL